MAFIRDTWRRITGAADLERKLAERDEELERARSEITELRSRLLEAPLDIPWIFRDDRFTEETKNKFLKVIEKVATSTPCNINLVVIGAVNSGKSSLVNTMKTVLRDSNEISTIASVYRNTEGSVTKKLHQVILKKMDDEKKIFIHDTRGIHADSEIMIADIKAVIGGHVPRNYEFTNTPIESTKGTKNSQYVENPTFDQTMHCALIVVDVTNIGNKGDIENIERIPLRAIIEHLNSNNIPFRLVLTKMDNLRSPHNSDLSCIITRRRAKKQYDLAKSEFGLQDSHVLPVMNYTGGHGRNLVQDVFALGAMKNIIQETMIHIENNS